MAGPSNLTSNISLENFDNLLSRGAAATIAEGGTLPIDAPSNVEVPLEERLLADLKRRDNEYRHGCAQVKQFLEQHKFFALFGQMRFRTKEEGDEFQRLVIARYKAGEALQDAMRQYAIWKVGKR